MNPTPDSGGSVGTRAASRGGRQMGHFRLGSVLGFEIRIDFSWFVIFFLILWSFSAGVFPGQLPDQPSWVHLTMGTAGALLFFASLLAHELSHSLVARSRGIEVEGITLFIFGGMARTRMEAENPGDELAIAGVGPLSSLAIAGLFAGVRWAGEALAWGPTVTVTAGYLAFLNVLLAGFNLMPGFPLDGGRVFRALVWRWSGDLRKATRWASTGGRWFGYLLIGLGALELFAGAVLGGLWLIFIGWFLANAAAMSYRQHVLRTLLEDVPARELMTADLQVLSPDLTLREAVDEHFMKKRHHAFPVVEGDRPLGLVTLRDVKGTSRDRWSELRVSDVMTDASELSVGPDESVLKVLELLQETDAGRVLVVSDDRLRGLVSKSDLSDWIQREEELEELRTGDPDGS